jgi:hypothetical protein
MKNRLLSFLFITLMVLMCSCTQPTEEQVDIKQPTDKLEESYDVPLQENESELPITDEKTNEAPSESQENETDAPDTEIVPEEPSLDIDTEINEEKEQDAPVEEKPQPTKPEIPKDEPKEEPKPSEEIVENEPLDHNKYWALQAAYNSALNTADIEDDIKASEDILSLYKNLEDLDSCKRVIVPLLKLSKIYEESGQFADALRCYEMYRDAYLYIDEHTDENCTEPLKYANSFINHYSHIEPTVYTTAKNPVDVPYFSSKNEPRVGTYTGMCGVYDDSISTGFLLYVQFGTETMSSFSYKLPKNAEHYMLELAWNTSDHTIEGFKKIADGTYDDYIIENLKWLDSLENCDVLLRFGAEVNEWEANTTYAKNGQLEEFKKQYIEAFRRVATLRNTHAPEVAMVYSPNDISNMYVSHLDFYPGDEYVDWVGMSSYMNKSASANDTWGSMTDAYYSRGKYASQILKMKPIIDAFGHKKPIVISECGFCYSSTNTNQNQSHAEEKLKLFYSYVNMVYPQVKAVYYFNTNFNGNSYQLFNENGTSANSNAKIYSDMMKTNIPIASLRNNSPEGYTRLTTLSEVRDTLNLALFASYPGNPEIKAVYIWDGVKLCETSVAPYHATIGKNKLTVGTHTLTVTTTCKLTTFTQNYTVTVASDGKITVK